MSSQSYHAPALVENVGCDAPSNQATKTIKAQVKLCGERSRRLAKMMPLKETGFNRPFLKHETSKFRNARVANPSIHWWSNIRY